MIEEAARELERGRLVAFPTETVYGLGALAFYERAVRRVFEVKGRPDNHPLIAHVATIADARSLSSRWPDRADALAAAFWPGPLTLVVPRSAKVPDVVTGGGPTVAVRAPSHPVAMALLARVAPVPIVAPSANRYQALSPTRADHVAQSLGDADVLLLDGGACVGGIESTVVDLSGARARVLRPGGVSLEALRGVIGEVDFTALTVAAAGAHASPGMDALHYAPRSPLFIAPSRREAQRLAGEKRARLVTFGACEGADVCLPRDPVAAAGELYAALHALDLAGSGPIVVEAPPTAAGWEGVADRLGRAAKKT